MSFRVFNDIYPSNVRVGNIIHLPLLNKNAPPPVYTTGIGYEVTTNSLYYCDQLSWKPISVTSSGGPTSTQSFAFIKGANQNIPPSVETIVADWSIAGSPTYSSLPQWDLSTGIYTATAVESLYLSVDATWIGGVTNQGNRILRIKYQPNLGVPSTIRQGDTQADANVSIPTTQSLSGCLALQPGDQVWISAFQNSNVAIPVGSSLQTAISGFRIINV